MKKTFDAVLDYRGFGNCHAKFRLRVYEAATSPTVVIATELPDNPGTSVIHMVSHLAGGVWRLLEAPVRGMTWIEHVASWVSLAGRLQPETFSRVSFCRSPPSGTLGNFAGPNWELISKRDVEALVGASLAEERRGR